MNVIFCNLGDMVRDVSETGVTDGRRLRSERSRRRLVESATSFIEENGRFPTAAELSAHSGVAHRSIFRLFADLDEIRAAVFTQAAEQALEQYVAPEASLPLDERIAQLAKTRTTAHEKTTPLREVAAQHLHESEVLGELTRSTDKALRDQLSSVFSDELKALGTSDRRIALNTLDAALSWEAYRRLRVSQELSKNAVQQIAINICTAALPAIKGRKRKA